MLWWTLRQLKSEYAETRKRAVEKLGELGNAKAVKPLIAALNNSY
jgi:HEAT repeat protein